MHFSSHKINQKIKLLKVLFSNSSEHWTNNYRAWRKTFRQGYQNCKLQSSSRKIKQKINYLKNLFFFKFSELWTNIYRAWRKSFGQGYQICKLYSKSSEYHVADKFFFEGFVGFPFIRTCNKAFLNLWQQSFQPGCQKDILGVYMSPLWDVGNRSDMNWREIFFEPWRKIFDLFLKTAFYVSKGTFWGKNFFWKFCFFSNSSDFWTNIYCAWRESFCQGYRKWKMHFSSHKINQKIKLLKVLFLSLSSELWTNIYRAGRKRFGQRYQNWKLQSSSQKINQKIIFLKILFFNFRILNKQLPCLAKKFSSGMSKLKIAVFVS